MTPEKQVENSILEYLKMRGVFCFKVNTGGVFDPTSRRFRKNKNKHVITGVADILGVLPNGRFLAIEVKTPNSSRSNKTYATDNQKFFIANIKANGGLAFIARSVDDVKAELTQLIIDRDLSVIKFEGPLR